MKKISLFKNIKGRTPGFNSDETQEPDSLPPSPNAQVAYNDGENDPSSNNTDSSIEPDADTTANIEPASDESTAMRTAGNADNQEEEVDQPTEAEGGDNELIKAIKGLNNPLPQRPHPGLLPTLLATAGSALLGRAMRVPALQAATKGTTGFLQGQQERYKEDVGAALKQQSNQNAVFKALLGNTLGNRRADIQQQQADANENYRNTLLGIMAGKEGKEPPSLVEYRTVMGIAPGEPIDRKDYLNFIQGKKGGKGGAGAKGASDIIPAFNVINRINGELDKIPSGPVGGRYASAVTSLSGGRGPYAGPLAGLGLNKKIGSAELTKMGFSRNTAFEFKTFLDEVGNKNLSKVERHEKSEQLKDWLIDKAKSELGIDIDRNGNQISSGESEGEGAGGASGGEHETAVQWAQDHPDDPRSKKILQINGIQ